MIRELENGRDSRSSRKIYFTILAVGLISYAFSHQDGSLKTLPKKTICEYLDLNNSGNYETKRFIKLYRNRVDTSSMSSIRLASPFSGTILPQREWSKEELEGYFKTYKWPEVDEIRFKDS